LGPTPEEFENVDDELSKLEDIQEKYLKANKNARPYKLSKARLRELVTLDFWPSIAKYAMEGLKTVGPWALK